MTDCVYTKGPTDCDGLAWETNEEPNFEEIKYYKCKNKINSMVTCGHENKVLGDTCPACGGKRWKKKKI